MKRTIFTRSFLIPGMVVAMALCLFCAQQAMAQPACTGGQSAVNFINESFENGFPAGWVESGNGYWQVNSISSSSNTGTNTAHDGTFFLLMETSVGTPPSTGAVSNVEFPVDLTGSPFLNGPYEMSFWYFMAGCNVGDLNVNVSTNGGASYVNVFALSGEQPGQVWNGTNWLQATVDLSSFAGNNIIVQIQGILYPAPAGCFTFNGDIQVDLLQIAGCGTPCTINCPPDVTVDNSPGLCGANVNIPLPTVSGNCAGVQTIFGEDFNDCLPNDPPTGWTTQVLQGGGGNIGPGPCPNFFFSFDCVDGGGFIADPNPDFEGCIAVMDDDGAGFAFQGIGAIVSPVIDLSAANVLTWELDYTWEELSSEARFDVWDGASWVNLETFGFAEEGAGHLSLDLTAFNNSDFQLRVVHDDTGGSFAWGIGFDNVEILAAAPAPTPINDYNGTANASDFYPVGTTVVTYGGLVDEFGNDVTCTFSVTVNDVEGPEFLNCPTDITFNLDPGACDAIVSYSVEAVDNCPATPFVLAGPFCDPCDDPTAGSALACTVGPNSIIQGINVSGISGTNTVNGIWFNQETFGTTTSGVLNLFCGGPTPVPWAAGGFSPIATQNFTIMTANNGQCVFIPLDNPVQITSACNILWVEIVNAVGRSVQTPATCAGNNATGTMSFIVAPACGLTTPGTFQGIGFILEASYAVELLSAEVDVVQIDNSGFTSGDFFPIGCHQQTYVATDAVGNTSVCDFEVCVAEYPFPIQSLTCNDLVNISLEGENCSEIVGADLILEGGPYGCYLEYDVNLFFDEGLTQPVNNNATNDMLNGSNLGQTLYAQVIDTATGNSCWGQIFVEDKVPPVLTCPEEVVVPCDLDLSIPLEDLSIPAGPEMTLMTLSQPNNGGNSGGMVYFTVNNLTGADLNVLELGMTISNATTVDVYLTPDTHMGKETNMGAWTLVGTCNAPTGPFSGPVIGAPVITPAPVVDPFVIPPGSWGMGLVTPAAAQSYTNGTGANQSYSDGTLEIDLGSASNAPFGAPFIPRVWNGYITYQTAGFGVEIEVSDACDDDVDLTFEDVSVQEFGCTGDFDKIISRVYTATDNAGNTATCLLTISVERIAIEDVTFPPNWDDIDTTSLACDNAEPDPGPDPADQFCGDILGWNALPNGYPSPFDELYPCGLVKWFGTGAPAGFCENINCTYEDLVIPVCPGTYKILRSWTCIDWCTGQIREEQQIIKVADHEAPTVVQPDITVNAVSDCQVLVEFPVPTVSDNCNDDSDAIVQSIIVRIEETGAENPLFPVIPQPGCQRFCMMLPVGTNAITYLVDDGCGNITEHEFDIVVVDFGPPVPICDEQTTVALGNDGLATVCWQTFDDGSFDNCGIVAYKVRRMDAPPFVGFTDCVQFDCDDVPAPGETNTIIVVLRIYDKLGITPPTPPGWPVNDPIASYNECMIEVEVQDKLDPFIACPPNKNLDCWEFDPSVIDGVSQDPNSGPPAFFNGEQVGWYPGAFDNCDVTRVDIVESGEPNNCGEGNILRIYTAFDVQGRSTSCVQQINITNTRPFYILDTECWTFPVNPFLCDLQNQCIENLYGTWNPNGGLPFPAEQCFEYPHCLEDGVEWPCDITLDQCGPGLTPDELEQNPGVNPNDARPRIFEDFCDLVGVTYDDVFLPIQAPGCIKVLRTWIVIDWCQPDPNDPLGYKTWTFLQEIKVLESAPPVVNNCEDITICTFLPDCSPQATTELVLDVEDDCTAFEDLNIIYKIDLFNDGGPLDGFDFTNEDLPTSNPLAFPDNAPNEANGEYPVGTHKIFWKIEDGCGNVTYCEYLFKIEDCKKPTPLCYSGLVTVVMPSSQMVDIFAWDYDAGSYDNCTANEDLVFSFSEDPDDNVRTFTCDDFLANATQPVDIYVFDEEGNFDFCTTFILLQDPNNVCMGTVPTADVSGGIETEGDKPVGLVDVMYNGNNQMSSMMTTGPDGAFNFVLPTGSNYTITPEKDINPLNGVTTYDLVLISQHILGIQPLGSPYKIIAADATNDGLITTFDIVQLRQLILAIINELPDNDSWRFVDAGYVFPNANNPFVPAFPEVIDINNLANNIPNNDFVGVKIGDVNEDVNVTTLSGEITSNDRDFNGSVVFNVDDRSMRAGDIYTVDFKASDFTDVLGYQFTLTFDKEAVEFVDLQTGDLKGLSLNNFGLTRVDEGIITTSWNAEDARAADNEVLFSVTFKARENAQLSNLLNVTDRVAAAEAYNTGYEFMEVALRFDDGELVGGEFELYQNEPNPFKAETIIGFNLPQATTATLKIYDVSGKVLKVINGDFAKGYNHVTVDRSDLGASGVLYYQLDTDNNTATKKMILIE